MANKAKRILSITIKTMVDDSPDTSWLGEYSNNSENEFTIDRKHSLDCQINNLNREALAQVERIMDYINGQSYASDADYDNLNAAHDVLVEAQDALQECDCGERGDMGRNEYRYFNASDNYKGLPADEIRKYVRRDYERMEAGNRGDWYCIGIQAEAEIQVTGDTVQRVSSGGIWGVESDSDASYLGEIEQEELAQLKAELRAIGFGTRAIAAAMRDVQHKEAA